MFIAIVAIGFGPTVKVGFALSVPITKVSFTHVDHISFTFGFVFAKKIAMTNSIVACNCSIP
jgi:hypothetical protein